MNCFSLNVKAEKQQQQQQKTKPVFNTFSRRCSNVKASEQNYVESKTEKRKKVIDYFIFWK